MPFKVMHAKTAVALILLFAFTQVLGLLTANQAGVQELQVTLVTDDKEDVINVIALFLYILFVTAVFLVIVTVVKVRGATFLFEFMALLATSVLVFGALLPSIMLLPVVLLLSLRLLLRKSILVKNIVSSVAVAGAGALIGVSLGVFPAALFLAILAVYDYIAVFKTKHMVKMAEAMGRDESAFTFSIPAKERNYQLGTGDLVMPLVFSVAVLDKARVSYAFPYYLAPVSLILLASVLGLGLTIYYLSKKGHALPALPLQCIFMLTAWLSMLLAGMPLI